METFNKNGECVGAGVGTSALILPRSASPVKKTVSASD